MEDGLVRSILDSAIQRAGQPRSTGVVTSSGGSAAPAGAAPIRAVHIVLGEMVDIEASEFQARWRALARGTQAEHAALHIRREPAELQCMVCFQKYHPAGRAPLCPHCGSVGAKVLSGEQRRVELVEVGDD